MATPIPALNSRIVPGLLVAAAGVVLLLHNLEILRVQGIWRFWPVLLIAFGLSQVLNPRRQNLALGIVFLAFGSFFQLANLNLIDIRLRDLWRFWPLILIVLGVGQLISRRHPRNLTGGLVLLGLGVYFQLSLLDLIDLSLWQLWPIALIAIGIGMVQRALMGRRMSH